eukprot:2694800-Amphidinium_carterae.1
MSSEESWVYPARTTADKASEDKVIGHVNLTGSLLRICIIEAKTIGKLVCIGHCAKLRFELWRSLVGNSSGSKDGHPNVIMSLMISSPRCYLQQFGNGWKRLSHTDSIL